MASSAALSPKLTTSTFLEIGVARHNSPVTVNFVKAFMGGLYLSLGGLLALLAGGGNLVLTATYPGLTKFITAAVFPVGKFLNLTDDELKTD
jgi:formate/nitrite transporter FocA (FNT family)